MSNLQALHKTLLEQWKQENDLDAVGKTLAEMGVQLNSFGQLDGLSADAATAIHRDFFELKALYFVVRGDMNGFEEAIADVHSFYQCQKQTPENKYLMLGLHLMYLLASSKLSDFHMLLEQIDQSLQQTNPYICMPVQLEQSLMEGAYNKVTMNEKTLPSPYYSSFVRVLMDTVRNDIASCMEKSFEQLLLKDAAKMLLLDNESDLFRLAEGRGWRLEKDMYRFNVKNAPTEPVTRATLDTRRIVLQNIYYAKQLEMIV